MGRFYKDQNSHNIFQELISLSESASVPSLEEIKANTTDAAQEKHVPVVTIKDNVVEVSVGSVTHPMLDEHYITGIYIETKLGAQYRRLAPGMDPKAVFILPEGTSLLRHMNTVIYTDYGKKTITKNNWR